MTQGIDQIRDQEIALPAVTTSRMFGTDRLKVGGKVYAMVFKGALVVKLSRPRAESLVAEGLAFVFYRGHGRPMKHGVQSSPTAGWIGCRWSPKRGSFSGSNHPLLRQVHLDDGLIR